MVLQFNPHYFIDTDDYDIRFGNELSDFIRIKRIDDSGSEEDATKAIIHWRGWTQLIQSLLINNHEVPPEDMALLKNITYEDYGCLWYHFVFQDGESKHKFCQKYFNILIKPKFY